MAAQYPTAAGTDANLFVAVNNLTASLTDNPLISGATTVNVVSTTGFPTVGIITIDSEAIAYTGITGTSFTTCTRGFDGTTAASHTSGTQVLHAVVAAHHNVLKDEVKAVETDLVNSLAAITPVTPAATAGNMFTRLGHIVSAFNTLTGSTWPTVRALLPLAGGTMTGAIAMGSNKVTGLGNASAAGDALAYGQLAPGLLKQITSTLGFTGNTITAASFTDVTGASVSITPGSSTSKILIVATFSVGQGTASVSGNYTLLRGATNLGDATEGFNRFTNTGPINQTLVYLDSPGTTSSTTYKLQGKSNGAANLFMGNFAGTSGNNIYAFEIGQ